ncbi:hypothetical protein CHARACLAT_021143 [Characodon lateralis]|uniref:Uncharacterized protein n=1 Tax=Characodon lateralis TaxID=208331 RepID=A0ABU7CZH1_9TELE|nr:hypothetical protein [Characodon lateralis]
MFTIKSDLEFCMCIMSLRLDSFSSLKPQIRKCRAGESHKNYQFLEKHGLGVEETATRGEACLQIPVCGFISGADGKLSSLLVTMRRRHKGTIF